MGDTQVGGNLSVHWLINADDVDPSDETTYIGSRRRGPKQRAWVQHGADYHSKSGGCGDNFTVRIKLPDEPDEFIASVLRGLADAKAKGRLEFELVIEKSADPHTQIQVAWAGGQKRATLPPWSDGLSETSAGNGSKSASARPRARASRASK
jgi:hypothetical protein